MRPVEIRRLAVMVPGQNRRGIDRLHNDVESSMTEAGTAPAVHAYLTEALGQMLGGLIGWVRLRSVAGLAEHQPGLEGSANWLAGMLRDVGFPTAEVWETEGAPAVYAEW